MVNALSESLEVEIWRDGQVYQQAYERGKPRASSRSPARPRSAAPRSPSARCADLRDDRFSFDTLAQRLRELAFLNGGVIITLDDERDGKVTSSSMRAASTRSSAT